MSSLHFFVKGGWGGHPLCVSEDSSVLMDLHWPCDCTTQSSFLSIGSVSVVLLWGIFRNDPSSSFLLFHSGQVFHQLVCPLTDVPPQIFFSLATLFSYPVFFSLFRASLGVVVHFFVFLRSIRFNFFLSQFSPLVAQIKTLCSDPGFFFWRCLPRISLAVSVTAVLTVVITESMSVSSLLMVVRGANLPPITAFFYIFINYDISWTEAIRKYKRTHAYIYINEYTHTNKSIKQVQY